VTDPCLHCALWRVIREHPGDPSEALPALANVVADILAVAPADEITLALMAHSLTVSGFVMARREEGARPVGARLQ
jgi:hypothetical protein